MDQHQHPDSIWTWKSNRRKGRASLWIPYLSEIEKKGTSWILHYRGGATEIKPQQVDTVMFYGASGSLPLEFIDDLVQARVSILIHRRNLTTPVCFIAGQKSDDVDVLTKQIEFRQHQIRRCYVARTLVAARFQSISDNLPIAKLHYRELARCRTVDKIRNWEAHFSFKYWLRYFQQLEVPEITRRSSNPYSAALNAGSMFMTGILLRWIHVHKLSPMHGYLHVRTEYISLVYDLIEPYRYMIEASLTKAVSIWNKSKDDDKKLTALTLYYLKEMLGEAVYVPSTRQHVRRKNLLHGAVLALRAYLIGDMRRFVLPMEGKSNSGRPIKVSYTLPGSIKR